MATVLALDNSGTHFSAAFGSSGSLGGDRQLAPLLRHCDAKSGGALPLIQTLLSDNNHTLADCDAFAFAAGPGKFSALRMVCAIAKTFAYAHKKPLLAVPGFAALAQANYGSQPLTIKCTLPAHRQHVYFSVCEWREQCWEVTQTALCSVERKLPAAAITDACGAGYQHYPHLLGNARLCNNAGYSDAAAVWQLAHTMLQKNQTSDPLTAVPFYLRRKVAATVHERNAS